MPLQATPTDPLFVSEEDDYMVDKRHHYLCFDVKITAKCWILL
jgi:hypothetical protein